MNRTQTNHAVATGLLFTSSLPTRIEQSPSWSTLDHVWVESVSSDGIVRLRISDGHLHLDTRLNADRRLIVVG